MPAPAPAPVSASASASGAAPVRRVVTILQAKIDSLEKQRSKTKDEGDDPSQILEFAWDLIKQVMGIAVLSENEAKKQARKDAAMRKSQDLQLVRDALIVLNCAKRLSEPSAKADVLSGRRGAGRIAEEDLRAIDRLYPELSAEPRPDDEEGPSRFESRSLEAAKHLIAIVEAEEREAFGTTYARLKSVVTAARETGFMDRSRTPEPEEEEEPAPPVPEEPIEEPEPVPVCALPPPAPQAVPAPAFSIMPPQVPPVTLQQIERAYFAQYGHRQRPAPPPAPEVIGPQSFIFLQESEVEGAEGAQQPPPVVDSPTASAIPSQTFTNQTYVAPPRFVPDPMQNPLVPVGDVPQPVHYAAAVVDVVPALVGNYPPPNPPIPIPPTARIPHAGPPGARVVAHPHPVRQQRLPSPFRQNAAFKPQSSHPNEPQADASEEADPEEVRPTPERDSASGEWAEPENDRPEQLEIDEWNPRSEGESGERPNGQASDKFRSRGRGRSSGNYRGRGGYQNGRSGNYYRNNDNYQSAGNNANGRNYNNENYRERNDGNRYENSQGGYQENFRGRGSNGRASFRQNGNGRGAPRGGTQNRGSGGSRSNYSNRKPTNGNQYETRNGVDNNKQQSFAN